MIPTSSHNEALSGDVLYSAFLNHEWREIVIPFIVAGMERVAAGIEDESARQDFEVLYGALIDDFYNQEAIVSGDTPVGAIMAWYTDSIPSGWLLCDGAAFDSGTYPALATVLGVSVTPDFADRFLYGSGATDVGDIGGAATHTLTTAEIPSHSHAIGKSTSAGGNNALAVRGDTGTATANQATTAIGGGSSHNNMPPYRTVHWIIKALA